MPTISLIKHHHCHHDLQHMMITFDIYRPSVNILICKSPGFRMIQPLRTIKDVLVFYLSTMPVESKKEIRQIS